MRTAARAPEVVRSTHPATSSPAAASSGTWTCAPNSAQRAPVQPETQEYTAGSPSGYARDW